MDQKKSEDKLDMGGVCGSIYQVELLMWFLHKGLSLGYDFELGTEIKQAQKFDDLVFKYKNKSMKDLSDHFCILQAKHKMNIKNNIEYSHIFNSKNKAPFGLTKYYFSYKHAKKENIFKNSVIEHAIIFTNASLDLEEKIEDKHECLKSLRIKDITEEICPERDNILSMCKVDNQGRFYRFDIDHVLPVLKPMILEYNDKRLAELLIVSLLKKKVLCHKEAFLKNYHEYIALKVINVNTCTFQEEFLKGNFANEKYFVWLQNLRTSLSKVRIDDVEINFEEIVLNKNNKFVISKGFGQFVKPKEKKQSWFKSCGVKFTDDRNDFLTKTKAILNSLAYKLVQSITSGDCLDTNDKLICDFHKLLAHDVINVEEKKFHEHFINCKEDQKVQCYKGLSEFREEFINEYKKYGFELQNINELINNGTIFLNLCIGFGKNDKNLDTNCIFEDNTNEEIKEFLKVFKLGVRQPNEKQFEKIIQLEMKKLYRQFDSKLMCDYFFKAILDWMKGDKFITAESRKLFISSEEAKDFFINLEQKFKKNILKGPLIEYNDYVEKFEIRFKDDGMKTDIKKFLLSEKRILNIVTEYITITSIKVYLSIEENFSKCKKYESEDFIYVRLSSLKSSSGVLSKVFESKDDHNLLIIECDLEEPQSEIFEEICCIIDSNINKKVIFISRTKHIILENFCNNSYTVKENRKNDFSNLKSTSRDLVLKKNVKFQGYDVKMKDLISEDSKKYISGDLLTKLIRGEEVKIGEDIKENTNCYVDRKFVRKLETEQGIYLISGFEEREFYKISNDKTFSDIYESKEHHATKSEKAIFNRVCEMKKSKDVRLLRKDKNKLYLLYKTSKTLHFIEHVNKKIEDQMKCDVTVLSAEAGMGKTTIFTRLSEKIKENNKNLWVIHVYLNDAVNALCKIQKRNRKIDLSTVLEFLCDSSKIKSDFEKQLFKDYLMINKVVLFLDAFDEITPSYKDTVFEIVKTLRKKAKLCHIWISTKPHPAVLKDLEDSFNPRFLNIESFSDDDQRQFLVKFWKSRTRSKFDEVLFHRFVDMIRRILKNSINDASMQFLSVVLHTEMIAETVLIAFEEFHECSSKQSERKLRNLLRLSSLYEKFISIKFNEVHYGRKMKFNLNQESVKETLLPNFELFNEKCRVLSMNSIFEEDLDFFLTKKQRADLIVYKKEIEERGDRIGIVNQIIAGKPHFVHLSFAEFFAADFFVRAFDEDDSKTKKILEYFLTKMIDNNDFRVVCNFIDGKLNQRILLKMKTHKCEDLIVKNNFIRIAIRNRWRNLLKFFINSMKVEDMKDELIGSAVDHENCDYENFDENMVRTVVEKFMPNLDRVISVFKGNFSKIFKNSPLDTVKFVHETCRRSENFEKIFDGVNVFYPAMQNHDCCVVEYLWENLGLDVEKLKSLLTKTKTFTNPLMIAAECGMNENIEILIEKCRSVNFLQDLMDSKNSSGKNVFYYAVLRSDSSVIKQLLHQLKDDFEILKSLFLTRDSYEDTPIMIAVKYRSLIDVKMILDACQRMEILNKVMSEEYSFARNVFHFAVQNRDESVLRYILENFEEDQLKVLIAKSDSNGDNPLMIAAKCGIVCNFKSLVEICAKLDILTKVLRAENLGGKNVFHFVAQNPDVDVLKELLKLFRDDVEMLKSSIRKLDKSGDTPSMVAVNFNRSSNSEILNGVCKEFGI